MEQPRYNELHKALQKHEKAIVKKSVAWGRKAGKERVTLLHAEAETGGSFDDFLKVAAGRSAVRFLLRLVYVRVLEDQGILAEPRIRGRRSYEAFRALAPSLGHRAYLAWVFRDLAVDFPALFRPAPDELPMPDEELCRAVWDLWHEDDGHGNLRYDWSHGGFESRFLGDLYQDLDADVRERYALYQTPDFVEAYILDHTLTPAQTEFDPVALRESGEAFRVLDPTCGSGHFLVGAFHRLADFWSGKGFDRWTAVELALEGVWGCDINPYAVDVARFRLLLECVQRTGETDLNRLSRLKLNLRAMDSLIPWEGPPRGQTGELFPGADRLAKYGTAEERAANAAFLGRDFHVVVGNPPYVTPKDARKRDDYRTFWPNSAAGKYGLAAPFIQRLFSLACTGGWTGQITGNAFTKREFGAAVVKQFLAEVDLTDIIDTSGAYIPGHGTPTVILFGRRRAPVRATIRCVGGKRGEPARPEVPSEGRYWSALVRAPADDADDDAYLTVSNYDRDWFKGHPWNLNGGGAPQLQKRIENRSDELRKFIHQAGVSAVTLADEIFVAASDEPRRSGLEPAAVARQMVLGEHVRDYSIDSSLVVIFPYALGSDADQHHLDTIERAFWPWRERLWRRLYFGKTQKQRGLRWFEYGFVDHKKLAGQARFSFPFVSTHNHFALDRGGRVFNRTAPIIKLPESASLADHLDLLGLLGSSTLGFWMKQVMFDKGNGGIGGGIGNEAWEPRFEYDSTKLKRTPIVTADREARVVLAEALDQLARERAAELPAAVLARSGWTGDRLAGALAAASARHRALTHRMVALQEELDWLTYQSYKLLTREPAAWAAVTPDQAEPLAPGHRPFEIALARHNATCDPEERSEWFARHGHAEVTDIPTEYDQATRARLQARLDCMAENKDIRLIEQAQFKRRWQMPDWDKEVVKACESWLLDRLEDLFAPAPDADPAGPPPPLAAPRPYTLEEIVGAWRRDPRVQAVADLYTGETHCDAALLAERLLDEHGLPDQPYRIFTAEGMRKLRQWQAVWDRQEREDAGEEVTIPKPPEFGKGDFQRPRFFQIRGKLNVPRERFIVFAELLPPRYGWNGWRDMNRALAQVEAYTQVEQHPLAPLPAPSSGDPRRCGATLGLWESLPDVRRWAGTDKEGELRALAEEACQQTTCPCELVEKWQAWQAGALEIETPAADADEDGSRLADRAKVLSRFNFLGKADMPVKKLQQWWNRSPAELNRLLDELVAAGELAVKGKGARRRYSLRNPLRS